MQLWPPRKTQVDRKSITFARRAASASPLTKPVGTVQNAKGPLDDPPSASQAVHVPPLLAHHVRTRVAKARSALPGKTKMTTILIIAVVLIGVWGVVRTMERQ